MKQPGHVFFIGLGLEPRDHASVETLVAVGDCDRVHHHRLEADDLALLKPFCRKGALVKVPEDADAGWARKAVNDASTGLKVAFVTLGHPFYDGPLAGVLAKACDAHAVKWTSYGAVSPMGVALSEGGLTLGTTAWGLQAYEHKAFVGQRPAPNLAWPTAIYFLAGPEPKSLKACFDRLLGFFPPEHPVRWCCGARRGESGTLGALAKKPGKIERRAVLYLGPARHESTDLGRTNAHHEVAKGPTAPEWVR